jgi:hypothetical protein
LLCQLLLLLLLRLVFFLLLPLVIHLFSPRLKGRFHLFIHQAFFLQFFSQNQQFIFQQPLLFMQLQFCISLFLGRRRNNLHILTLRRRSKYIAIADRALAAMVNVSFAALHKARSGSAADGR